MGGPERAFAVRIRPVPTRRVRLRMVLGEGLAANGKTSAKTSAARRNGMSAASFCGELPQFRAIGPYG